ncbi:FAD-binding oxidoreductase [Bradyrhizobium sp. Tv2a-2]|uniref:FAD-binding oxidoreductase n=1 Tax=Bradyrhizobium sp. Tv2a-2 TaxID=113395 RepID=UPI0003F5990A|nr:FAD-binding oxidoreductase [Bradyrhizobium sp. Tv2a-2]
MFASLETAPTRLKRQLPELVSVPGEDRYATAINIWAKTSGVMPRAVFHCRTAEDLQTAIRAAREHDLPLSIRGGGHDWAGRALCDGIVADMTGMRHVVLDADQRTATIGGGARAADVTAITDPLGRAVVTGSCSCVGMAGLTLGGGYGPLNGRFGLALDNMVAAQVVLADGRIVSADNESNADLFWALRGGGGNFGAVVAMRHHAHDLPAVYSGVFVYPFSEARTVLEACNSLTATAPDELSVQIVAIADPSGTLVAMVIPIWSGLPEQAERALEPFQRLGTLLAGKVERTSYGALLSVFDPFVVNGLRVVVETCSVPSLDLDTIDMIIHGMETAVSPGCAIITHEFRGAASRVSDSETAFGLRRDHVMLEMLATCPAHADGMDEVLHRSWARRTRQTFTMALPGGYPNFLGPNDLERARQSYGQNAARLIEIKRRYDPDNVFASAIPLPWTP